MLWGFSLVSFELSAQTPFKDSIKKSSEENTTHTEEESEEDIESDSLTKPNTKGMDSLQLTNEKGDIETTIFYKAEDSIMMDVPNKKAYLFGKAQIKYQDMQLDAEVIEIQWDKNIISAKGKVDSAGRYKGNPVWKQGPDIYVTDSMRYNMKTQKGIIHNIETKQGDGFLVGDTAKRTPEAIFLKNGRYSTCNLKHQHFYINARKLKVIPEDKAVCGPFNLVLEDIPTPIGFWMGFFPITDKKKSGIIFPTFGQNANRGLYLSRGGYYWAVNDYIGIQAIGDIYANGSWLLNTNATYLKKYKFRGTMDLGFSKVKDGFDPDVNASAQFRLVWSHSTIAKRNSSFTTSVNLTSNKYAKSNYYTTNRTNNVTASSITYRKTFGKSPFNASISLRGSQNNSGVTAANDNKSSSKYNMTLPAASLTMNRINPFKRKYGNGNNWYEKIYVNYQGNFNYDFTNIQKFYTSTYGSTKDSVLQVNEANLNKYILPNAMWNASHNATVSTTFKFLKALNVNPSANYYENWYQKKLMYRHINDSTTIINDTINGFFRSYYMNTSVEINTRIYGTVLAKNKKHLIQGIRHTVNPSIRMTYAPDFSRPDAGGGYTTVEGDVNEQGKSRRFTQYIGNPTPLFKQAVLDFNISNIIEMKVLNKKDTTGENPTKKVNLLDNLSIAGGYNFGADSLKMKNVTLNTRTKLLGRFDINLTSVFDPYEWKADSMEYINGQHVYYHARQTNTYLYDSKNKLAQLTLLNMTIGTRFAPKNATTKKDPKFNNPQMQSELDYIRANPNQYLDFNIPWSLGLSYTYNYSHQGILDPVINQAITANGDISLTPKWKIAYQTGYNLKEQVITYSNFTISRDLHCWQMNMTLAPFGSYRTFNFMIAAKSQLLQTLKLSKRSPTFIQ